MQAQRSNSKNIYLISEPIFLEVQGDIYTFRTAKIYKMCTLTTPTSMKSHQTVQQKETSLGLIHCWNNLKFVGMLLQQSYNTTVLL